jgi:hypothetical protein
MADPYIDNVVLALPFDQDAPGPLGSLDYSNYKQALTWNGNTRLSTDQSKFGGVSAYFDGTGDYLSIPYSASIDLTTGPFTIECYIYPLEFKTNGARLVATGGGVVDWNSTTGIHILTQLDYAGKLSIQWWNGSVGQGFTHTTSLDLNTWNHVSACFAEGVVYLSSNGVVQSAGSKTIARPSTNPTVAIGTLPGEAGNVITAFYGYINDLRITKGIARYTENFTPPIASFKSDYSIPAFQGRNIPALFGKSAFQWCLLDKKGVQIPASLKIRQDYKNATWGGLGTLSGTVKIGATPCKRRVRLYEASTGVLIREMWCAEDGSYTFLGLRTDYKYTVTSTDYSNFYNDVIAANITAIV